MHVSLGEQEELPQQELPSLLRQLPLQTKLFEQHLHIRQSELSPLSRRTYALLTHASPDEQGPEEPQLF
jgi:hypothetical protein